MSYDVELLGADGEPVAVEHFTEGGTYPIGGTDKASLNITYNYSVIYRIATGFSINRLNGQKAAATLLDLERLEVMLRGSQPYEKDYWAPTPGNAYVPINRLLAWAKANPEATWAVS